MEALAAGVPVLAVPQTPEQDAVARRIEEPGPGARLPPPAATPEALRAAIDLRLRRVSQRRRGRPLVPVGRDLPADANAEQVFDRVLADYPALYRRIRDEQGRIRRHVNVFLEEENLRRSSLDQVPVPPGSRIHVLPCISGG
jgi:hypothetical protein